MPLFKKKEEKNILEMVPFRVIKTFSEKDGLITLELPKFKTPFFSKYLIPKGKSETINIKFDRNGSLVWEHIDGKRSVQGICDAIKQADAEGEKLANLEERTAKFITELYKSRFINFMEEKL